MRDRETDSWWSIMTADAIGGELEGTDLVELPVGEKTSWKQWRQRHAGTVVLSVAGEEHVENNPYDNYFAGDGTFRNVEIDDTRLPPKEPVFSFWLADEPWSVAHAAYPGGRVFELQGGAARVVLLYRSPKAPIYQSSRAFLVDSSLAAQHGVTELLQLAESGSEGIEVLPGFDTFWYTWVATHPETRLMR